ncbi:MAG: protein kinase [Bifidobacteriaceae bacterium]|jgi:serine/threonine-protein kinase|nr:protein kinase [Bifidobacteriaceae bacterium]
MIAQTGLMLADGRYKLVSRIAVGGMGEVWRAHDLLADKPVAIKVLRQEFTGDQTSLKRLRIEARNASLLNHPNITTVHDYREHEGTGYLVMEYVDGQSLADVLAAHSIIAPMRLLPILIQSALGLHAAHSAGVVHRDVKPGNILLGPSDHVKLTDFGISVAHGQLALTDTGKVMGTAQYLAPEQALGNPATPAGDLYSLGVIAYEALAGRRPFRGANYVAIALSQVNDMPPPLPGTVERSLAALVMQLLNKDPAKRPTDGAQLASLFGEALETHRHLAGRLLASRSGEGPLPRSRRAGGPPRTAEQPAVPARSLMPPPAPATDVGPVVGEVTPPAAVPGQTAPTEVAPLASGVAEPANADQTERAAGGGQSGGLTPTGEPGSQGPPPAIAAASLEQLAKPEVAAAPIPPGGLGEAAGANDAAARDEAAGPADAAAPSDAAGPDEPAGPGDAAVPGGVTKVGDGAGSAGAAQPAGAAGPGAARPGDAAGPSGGAGPTAPGAPALGAGQTGPRGREAGVDGRRHQRRGPDAPPPTSPLSQAAPGLPPLPSAADLARPLGQPAAQIQPGVAAAEPPAGQSASPAPSAPLGQPGQSGRTGPAATEAPSPPAGRPRRRVRLRDWLWAILAGAGLLIIVLIGLLTVITANAQPLAPVWLTATRAAPATQGGVSIVSTVPELGPITER